MLWAAMLYPGSSSEPVSLNRSESFDLPTTVHASIKRLRHIRGITA